MDEEKTLLEAKILSELENLLSASILENDKAVIDDYSFEQNIEKWYFSATNALLAGNGAATAFLLKVMTDNETNFLIEIASTSIVYFMSGILIITLNYPFILFYKYRKEVKRLIQHSINRCIKIEYNFSKLKSLGYDENAKTTGDIAYYSSLRKSQKSRLVKSEKSVGNIEFLIFICVAVSGASFFQGVLKGLTFVLKAS